MDNQDRGVMESEQDPADAAPHDYAVKVRKCIAEQQGLDRTAWLS